MKLRFRALKTELVPMFTTKNDPRRERFVAVLETVENPHPDRKIIIEGDLTLLGLIPIVGETYEIELDPTLVSE